MRILAKALAIVLSLLLTNSSDIFALGSGAISNEAGVSAKATSHGYAFGGVADDPSAIHYNPAGLVQSKGFQTMVGAAALDLNDEHTSSPAGVNDKMASNMPVVPYFYSSYSGSGSPWAFGLGINSPFGLITEWKEDSVFKYYATKSTILMYNVVPSVAYSVNDRFSVGGGLNYFNVFDVELNALVFNGVGLPDGRSKLSGDGNGWGYNFGMHYKANDKHSFGLTYKSQVNVPVQGETELTGLQGVPAAVFGGSSFKTGTTSEVKFPQSVLVGYGFKPNNKWTVFADYEWVDWKIVENTEFNYAQNPFGALTTRIPRNWKSTNNIGIGAELKASDRVDLRFGTVVYERVVPSGTLEATLPEGARFGLELGTGIHFGKTTLDLGYGAIFLSDRSINNGQESALYSQDGEFKGMINVFSIGVSTKWGGQAG